MNPSELRRLIKSEELEPPVLYGEGELRNDAVVLENEGDTWRVFIANERGGMHESTFRTFDNEADALEHVLHKLRQSQRAARATNKISTPYVDETSEKSSKDTELSRAIVEYLGKGKRSFPGKDEVAVLLLAKSAGVDPEVLLKKVQAIISELMSIKIDWSVHSLEKAGPEAAKAMVDRHPTLSKEMRTSLYSLGEGGREARQIMAARHPELEDEALEALYWKFTYNWR